MDSHFTTVEHPESDFYAIHLNENSPYNGVRFIYGTVSIKESAELDLATLTFTYNINDPGDFDHDTLRNDEKFNNYLGDLLTHIIEQGTTSIAERNTDTHTKSST
jgi:hypothetical protein|tara:strand:+ start:300 stop:614 length:315 start_codon:yes stop_codon:yes gene_type:complete